MASPALTPLGFSPECHQTCFSCFGSDANQCTQCEKALVLDPNTLLCGVTGDTYCPPRTYLHDDQFTCMGCHRHCYSCEGPSNDECQTCAVPKYLQNSSCVSECPDGTYATEQDADGKELGLCLFCDNACSSCTGASPKDCRTCSVGHLRLYSTSVSIIVPQGITERALSVRDVTDPVSCVARGLSLAGPVPLLFWSYRAPSCVWSTVPIVSAQ
ncbi:proprotein convertase subtilisin/kexin type 5-like [Pseudochaenichthys georgianus]|uniref:proprotein convertase subtilisin/kexin type 5-like n=1 Tax=Pseudochaenichthys georgianus TaxID=52239 RepID=UPI0039C41A14